MLHLGFLFLIVLFVAEHELGSLILWDSAVRMIVAVVLLVRLVVIVIPSSVRSERIEHPLSPLGEGGGETGRTARRGSSDRSPGWCSGKLDVDG